jgi:hypothetical protein
LAVLAPDVLAPDASELRWPFQRHLQARLALGAPYTQGAGPSAERSFAAAALSAAPARSGRLAWKPWPAVVLAVLRAAAAAQPGCSPKVVGTPVVLPVEAPLEPRTQPIEVESALEQ